MEALGDSSNEVTLAPSRKKARDDLPLPSSVDETTAAPIVPSVTPTDPMARVAREGSSPDGSASRVRPVADADLGAREVFEQVEKALVNLGFKKKDAARAVVTVGPAMAPSKQTSAQAVLVEAIAFLAPARPRRHPFLRSQIRNGLVAA